MRILVAIREVPDPAFPVQVLEERQSSNLEDVPRVINPFDEIALEEAIKFKEQGLATDVFAVTVGPRAWEGSLRTALAMGADRGILIEAEPHGEPLLVAQAIARQARTEAIDLILMGRQGIDCDHGVTAAMTAGILDWPQATFVSRIDLSENTATVEREVDGGRQRLQLTLPAVISVDLGLNTPRYASLPNIMKARAKPIAIHSLPQMPTPSWDIMAHIPPPGRPKGRRVTSVAELIAQLERLGVLP
ncbi:MAG: electron transfer flavoprotein subunit beta/FixA family protein [Magnetococcales bacterium]|nr:electron transfer flavoprotein subunit beta/FixA family protein [Magnetococcales bacterium]